MDFKCKIDFKWEMDETGFQRLKDDMDTGTEDVMYGKVLFGNYSCEICLYCDYIGLNLYHIGVDSGYGYTRGRGTPYDYEDGPTMDRQETASLDFDAFKKAVEQKLNDTFFPQETQHDGRGWLNRSFIEKEVLCPLADWA